MYTDAVIIRRIDADADGNKWYHYTLFVQRTCEDRELEKYRLNPDHYEPLTAVATVRVPGNNLPLKTARKQLAELLFQKLVKHTQVGFVLRYRSSYEGLVRDLRTARVYSIAKYAAIWDERLRHPFPCKLFTDD